MKVLLMFAVVLVLLALMVSSVSADGGTQMPPPDVRPGGIRNNAASVSADDRKATPILFITSATSGDVTSDEGKATPILFVTNPGSGGVTAADVIIKPPTIP